VHECKENLQKYILPPPLPCKSEEDLEGNCSLNCVKRLKNHEKMNKFIKFTAISHLASMIFLFYAPHGVWGGVFSRQDVNNIAFPARLSSPPTVSVSTYTKSIKTG
jgi:hypothetical protein